ncbi:MAG: PrsW family glutamic-type intramembrane protease [Chthoniobacteraceae bacterium]
MHFSCPNCNQHFDATEEWIGSILTCTTCHESFVVPGAKNDPLSAGPSATFGMEEGGDFGVAKAVGVFKTLDYGFLIPFKKIFNLQLLKKKAVRWVLLLGIAPIGIYVTANSLDLDFEETLWLFEIYFCVFWAMYFYGLINPSSGVWKRGLGYAVFTVFIGVPFDLFAQSMPIIRNLYRASDSHSLLVRIVGYVAGIGILEEAVKALPLLLFGLRKGTLKSLREGLILGFMSGLGFAASEGVSYSLAAAGDAFGASSENADVAFTVQILQTVFRLMSSPLLHAAWAGTVGWFIALAASRNENRWPVIVVGIAFMAALHGVNDVVAGTFLHVVTGTVTIMIFMAYLVHGEESKAEVIPHNPSRSTPELLTDELEHA